MEILVNILLWIHLLGLIGAGGGAVAMPAIGGKLATATPDTQSVLFDIVARVSTASRGSLGVLIVTGPLLFWLKWDFTAPSMAWFGVKMLLVLALLAAVIVAGINLKKARQGDMAALKTGLMASRLMGPGLLLTVLCAVFAFN